LLADSLRRWSDKPQADCAELFRRMVFNAAVTNNDDHPRNHALLRRQNGWRLSPAYDLVPAHDAPVGFLGQANDFWPGADHRQDFKFFHNCK
jgi:serine/threonine protein kinase HipA of HipAB toxin-antitoxin module